MRLLSRFAFLLLATLSLCSFVISSGAAHVLADDPLPDSEIKALNQYPNWVADACALGGTATTAPVDITPGSGAPDGTIFPNLDPTAMGDAIDAFIKQEQPSSPLKDLGSVIVASAKNSNVNPFLITGIADQETSLATADTPQVTAGHAPFNRRATSSQPHISISTGIWYKWSSFKASVDYTAPENHNANGGGDVASYIAYQYKNEINSGDLTAFISKYDPGGGSIYVDHLKTWMGDMAQKAGGSPGGSTQPTSTVTADSPSDGSSCCSSSSSTDTTGTTASGQTTKPASAVQQVVWNTLIAGGIDAMHTAAVMGNIAHEGVWDPTNIEDPAGTTTDRNAIKNLTGQTQGYGLIGWTPGNVLLKQMNEVGVGNQDPYTAETQSAVILGQIQGKTSSYDSSVGKAFLATNTIESATQYYEGGAGFGFERPYDPGATQADRIASAKEMLNKFSGDNPLTTLTQGGTQPLSDTINNVTDPAPTSAASCCPTGSSGAGSTLQGNTPGEQVFNYFVTTEHFSNEAAAAATGNLQLESGFSPTVDNGQGYVGLAQWGGGRLSTLQGKSNWQSLDVQLKYVSQELHSGYKTALNEMLHDTSIEDLTYDWVKDYEGATSSTEPRGVQAYYDRLRYAKQWLQKAQGGGIDAPDATATLVSDPTSDPSADSGCSTTTSSSGYSNPFHSTDGLTQSRIDEGVDYASTKPVPLYAIGNGIVKIATDQSTFFTTSGGHADWITYQLTDGPAAGKYIYVSEACPPLVHVGETVSSNTHLCDVLPDSIETGWALDDSSQAAAADPVYDAEHDGYETAYGVNFNKLLVSLGAPSGHLDTASDPSGEVLGSLPANWPVWDDKSTSKADTALQ